MRHDRDKAAATSPRRDALCAQDASRRRFLGWTLWGAIGLLGYLVTVQSLLETSEPFQIFSGYRSPETNARLRRAGIGAAPNSYHLKGQAVDLWLPGSATTALHKAALAARRGGVGYYPDRHFVHLDVGPVRHWSTS